MTGGGSSSSGSTGPGSVVPVGSGPAVGVVVAVDGALGVVEGAVTSVVGVGDGVGVSVSGVAGPGAAPVDGPGAVSSRSGTGSTATGPGSAGGRNDVVGLTDLVPRGTGAGMCAFGGSSGSDLSTVTRPVAGGRASTGPSLGSVAVEVVDNGCVASVGSVGDVAPVVPVGAGVADSRADMAKVGAGAVDRQTPTPIAIARRHPVTMKTMIPPVSRFIFSPQNTSAGACGASWYSLVLRCRMIRHRSTRDELSVGSGRKPQVAAL
ncbi:hypothetical protein M0E78_04515 [Corynebacterium sp. P6145]|uniref:hypothetical protein n=1 Tax=Corynebacterium antarcticum TaxID=2800405 RepID=UPI002002D6F5|nr:hypothetical protein [Corynebacterium antarcticum]MCK7642176.1 hypothetical protein [Corynebacterium antarcticum]